MKLKNSLLVVLTGLSAIALPLPLLVPQPVAAQNNFVLWGSGKDSTLPYIVRNKQPGARLNFYTFYATLPKSKAVAELQISYPDGFANVFNPENVRIFNRSTQQTVELKETSVDRESNSVRYVFKTPIPAQNNQELEIICSGVSNPSTAGMYRIQIQALGTEANPLFQYLGQWVVTIL